MPNRVKNKRGGLGTALILIGLLCFVGAAGFTAYNYWDSARAEKASYEIVQKLDQYMEEIQPETDLSDPASTTANATAEGQTGRKPRTDVSYREMHTVEIDGYLYIGELEIPSLSLTLPVMQKWDYERLKISPCRYSGSYNTDDLVICAHNYARHFSPIKGISMGADVWFVTVDGERIHYITSNIQTIQPTSVDEMVSNDRNSLTSNNSWDLTLFTCNTGGMTRCAIRCTRTE